MTQQNQPPKPATNPFATATSRFSPGAAASGSNAPAAPAPGSSGLGGTSKPSTPTTPPRPNALGSRLGPTKLNWRIMPVGQQLVRFDLNGLGDPFYRLLGKRLTIDFGDPQALYNAFDERSDDVQEMIVRLDEAWNDYQLRGAILLYPWNRDLPQTLVGRIPNDDDTQPDENYDDDKRPSPVILRAFDVLLVMNVLSRTRANILLKNAPLALERQYLSQSLYSDDQRLIALVQATGCIEESLLQ